MDTFTLEQLDFSEIQRAMDEILNQSFSFRDTVLSLLSGEQPFTLESFFGRRLRKRDGASPRINRYLCRFWYWGLRRRSLRILLTYLKMIRSGKSVLK